MNDYTEVQSIDIQFAKSSTFIDPELRAFVQDLENLINKYSTLLRKHGNSNAHYVLSEEGKLIIKGIALLAGIALLFVPAAGPALFPLVSVGGPVVTETIINLYHKSLNKKIDTAWALEHKLSENPHAFFQKVATQAIDEKLYSKKLAKKIWKSFENLASEENPDLTIRNILDHVNTKSNPFTKLFTNRVSK